jgi:hypothetical protein
LTIVSVVVVMVVSNAGQAAISTVAAVVAALAALGQALPGLLRRDGGITSDLASDAARGLATSVRRQWLAERYRLRLDNPDEMQVQWTDSSGASGDLNELIESFVARPGRLVVTGDAGSGKSCFAVLLTLALLSDRASAGRVPVLLRATTWDPDESMPDWIARRLIEDHPWLPLRYGPRMCHHLAEEHVLPIIDGLDEMPSERRSTALIAIDEFTTTSDPLVLTSRGDEYYDASQRFAVGTRSPRFPASQIVTLLPLRAGSAAKYLLLGASDAVAARWRMVSDILTARPGSPLTHTLTRPLMLFLARTVYSDQARDPEDLLDSARFPDEAAIEAHLLDAYVPTVFDLRPARRQPNPTGPQRAWRPRVVRNTLTFLARYLSRAETTELAWWHLYREVPGSVFLVGRLVVSVTVCTALGGLGFALFGVGPAGLLFWAGVGASIALVLTAIEPGRPRRAAGSGDSSRPPTSRSSRNSSEWSPPRLSDLIFGGLGGVASGSLVGVTEGTIAGVAVGVSVGIAFLLVFWLLRRATEPAAPSEALGPISMLRADRSGVIFASMVGLFTGSLVGAMIGWFVEGIGARLVIDLDSRWQVAMLGALVGGVVNAIGLGLLVASSSAWGRFLMTRLWLAWRGWAPTRFIAFLDDAHRAGILRQAGGYYEFRHALLRDRLAAGSDAGKGLVSIAPQRGKDTASNPVEPSKTSPD